jgi:hypothetical protein
VRWRQQQQQPVSGAAAPQRWWRGAHSSPAPQQARWRCCWLRCRAVAAPCAHRPTNPTKPTHAPPLTPQQECFNAGYASFNLEPVQYSSTAAAGYAEANKYGSDPKGVDKYGNEPMPAKVSGGDWVLRREELG